MVTVAPALFAHRFVPTPIGLLLVAATERGIVRVAFAAEDVDAVLDELRAKVGPGDLVNARTPATTTAHLDATAWQLDEYFDQARRDFDLTLDDRLVSGFRREVLAYLPEIPYGETQSYGDVAASVGRPGAARAVGTACGANRLAVLRPCHRVIRSDGALGGFGGNEDVKQILLDLER